MEIWLVTGTVCKSEYMVDGEVRYTDHKLVKADSVAEAQEKFVKFWEDQTDEYSVYYNVVNVKVQETLE